MKYCKKCWIPDTRPYISFDKEGVCGACRNHELKNKKVDGIDWEGRAKQFAAYTRVGKSEGHLFDVVVPVSGGKDSIMQVHRLLKYDLRILAVNVDYGINTKPQLHPKHGSHFDNCKTRAEVT